MAEIEGHETFLYKKLYEHAVNNSDIYYIFVGKEYAHFKELKHIKIVKTKEEALKSAKSIINGKKIPCTILVKGARKNAFEEIVERMAFPGVLQDVV
jgi:UDP-N-acetylmuramyl pentapeptide synthase